MKSTDNAAMIRLCLKCKWPECWNCLGLTNCYSYGLRLELEKEDDAEE